MPDGAGLLGKVPGLHRRPLRMSSQRHSPEGTTPAHRWCVPDLTSVLPKDKTYGQVLRQWLAESPEAAEEAAVLALTWLARGHGWEVTADDALAAYSTALAAADRRGTVAELRESVRSLFAQEAAGSWLRSVLARELDR